MCLERPRRGIISHMTITVELSAEEEARLRTQARQRGQDVEAALRALVRDGLAPEPDITEEAHAVLIQDLLSRGLLTELPTHPGLTTPFQPITVLGPPVSQTLLEDRE